MEDVVVGTAINGALILSELIIETNKTDDPKSTDVPAKSTEAGCCQCSICLVLATCCM